MHVKKLVRTLRTIALPFIVSLCLLALAYICLQNGYIRFNYPSKGNYPIQGIDVSHHQGDINWKKLAATGLRFAYIKSTEGGDFVDKKFFQNWKDSQTHGFVSGAYHFYTFCRPVKDQIDNIVRVVPRDSLSLPIAIDLEFGGNCKKMPKPSSLLEDIKYMSSKLRRYYEKKPLLYMTSEFDKAYPEIRKLGLRIWIRNIYFEPNKAGSWNIWQFSNRGRLPGINGPVDLNAFRGEIDEFIKFYKIP